MTDLKIIIRIARTDLAILFYSPIAWFILIVFSFLTTASFTSLMENVAIETTPNPYNERYLRTKKERMGHTLHFNK